MNLASAAAAAFLLLATVPAARGEEVLRLRVDPSPFATAVPRVGLNVGTWTSFGADQLMANVLKNPGFEGTIDRAVVRVARVAGARFSDDDAGLARPDGFWIGATFDVRTGTRAGTGGTIVDSRAKGSDGLPELRAEKGVPGLAPGDVVVLTRLDEDGPPFGWTIPPSSAGRIVPSPDVRPGSRGTRSLALTSVGGVTAEVATWLDSIGDRGGKMLPVEGPWRLSLWCRGEGGARLRVSLRRVGSAAFVESTIAPGPAWTEKTLDFAGRDQGPAAPLEVRIAALSGSVHVDDVSLSSSRPSTGAFRGEVGELLALLRPGLLRDWQGQLGDTLENRLAPPFARRASRYRPGGNGDFGWSIPELLELCRASGARPWIIAPPAFSDDEWRGLGKYLSVSARDLGEVIVELGNENWNPIFRPGGLPGPKEHGALASRAARLLREGCGGLPVIRFAVNGPHVDPGKALAFATEAEGRDILAVAPYVLHSLAGGLPGKKRLDALFTGDGGGVEKLTASLTPLRVELASAEVNVHTLGGNASAAERRPIVAGAVAGTALARRLLDALLAGVKKQCVWSLSGYETFTNSHELVPLFGVTRDLGPTRRLRPSGLALAMLNHALPGDAHRTSPAGSSSSRNVTVVAFRSVKGWSVVAASAEPEPVELEIALPPGAVSPRTLLVLDAASPLETNEEREAVTLKRSPLPGTKGPVRLPVPPRGLVVAAAGENAA